ncbi:beta-glucanase [Dysgonomonas sp. 216]|uniref:glycoside hydrolase family 43 protein n=1 Tax=Dysgonomonas sp. 216 TaxID=2302934 RepID=UPI0013D5DDAF|nr:glycoside hydrolase family 43 protein [Dysgonomonas sp. 216]NDW17376.1 beta-glucanase [Dysgonomonas sp. 216]
MNKSKLLSLFLIGLASIIVLHAQKQKSFYPGKLWFDTDGKIINAHGGGILYHKGTYYWFGEHKGEHSNDALVGVTCYSSTNLYDWTFEQIALPVSDDKNSSITKGCIIERPKVIFNEKTGKFVMYFHLELKGQGYNAAHVGVAISDNAAGPYVLVKNGRVNAGIWPINIPDSQKKLNKKESDFKSWTPEWLRAMENGMFLRRDFKGGQMSRDMTLFVDDDSKAYHIYSSEDNATLQIAELTDDYLGYTGKYIRIFPAKYNEAPAIFKKDGVYWMITSGCTGWKPNEARMFSASSIFGTWSQHPNPCRGEDSELTFHSQSTYILHVQGKENLFVYMGDRWIPSNPIDGRYVWLPILFEDNKPVLKWMDRWSLNDFD